MDDITYEPFVTLSSLYWTKPSRNSNKNIYLKLILKTLTNSCCLSDDEQLTKNWNRPGGRRKKWRKGKAVLGQSFLSSIKTAGVQGLKLYLSIVTRLKYQSMLPHTDWREKRSGPLSSTLCWNFYLWTSIPRKRSSINSRPPTIPKSNVQTQSKQSDVVLIDLLGNFLYMHKMPPAKMGIIVAQNGLGIVGTYFQWKWGNLTGGSPASRLLLPAYRLFL